jgi:hypothetical protein
LPFGFGVAAALFKRDAADHAPRVMAPRPAARDACAVEPTMTEEVL